MSEFIEYLHEIFAPAGTITIKRMFDGHTLYLDGLPVGIIYQDTLYLKADAETKQAFEALQLPQFTYRKKDKTIGLPYYQAPDFILEDRHEAALWLRKAFEASLRTMRKSKKS